jgi:hypothetical protein
VGSGVEGAQELVVAATMTQAEVDDLGDARLRQIRDMSRIWR